MSPEEQLAWEEELVAETVGPARDILNRLLASSIELQAEWVQQRRLAIRLSGLQPRADTGLRVLALIHAQRESRRHTLSRAINRRRKPASRWRWLPATVAVLAAVLVAAVLWTAGGAEPESPRIRTVNQEAGQTLAAHGPFDGVGELHWNDGSRAVLAPGSRVEAIPGIGFRQLAGSSDITVTASQGRHFTVLTPAAEVIVVGTDFRVEVLPTGTRVAVRTGTVLVAGGGVTQRIEAGQQCFAGSTGMLREQVDWHFTAGADWPGSLVLGTLQRGLVESGVFLNDGPTKPCVQLEAPAGGAVFAWQPGQILTARVQLGAARQRIGVQFYDRSQSLNFMVYTEVVADGSGWGDLAVLLDQAKPYQEGARLAAGAPIAHLILVSAATEQPFRVQSLSVVRR